MERTNQTKNHAYPDSEEESYKYWDTVFWESWRAFGRVRELSLEKFIKDLRDWDREKNVSHFGTSMGSDSLQCCIQHYFNKRSLSPNRMWYLSTDSRGTQSGQHQTRLTNIRTMTATYWITTLEYSLHISIKSLKLLQIVL